MKIVSWNVNGVRAVHGRQELAWVFQPAGSEGAVDVVCLQETKIQPEHVKPEVASPPGFERSFWCFHKTKKGYSGTAVFVRDGMHAAPFPFLIGGTDHPEYDDEGRVCGVDLGEFVLLNVYFPNGGASEERLRFKARWHDAFLDAVLALEQTRAVVVCGDFNIAHRDLDLALPERWRDNISGALAHERAWFDRLVAAGFIDSFRAEKGDLPRQFTWWETRVNARPQNQGWRIDYVVISKALEERLLDAWISPQIFGSDHCPVGAELHTTAAVDRTSVPHAVADDDIAGAARDDDHASDDDNASDDSDDSDDDNSSRWRR